MPNGRERTLQQLINALQQLSTSMVVYSSRVSKRVGVTPTDIEAAELLDRHGPKNSRQLAREHGLPEDEVRGAVERLKRAGFATTEGDTVRVDRDKLTREIAPLYEPAVRTTREVSEQFTDEQLEVIADFLTSAVAQSGRLLEQV
jgi:predicted transcriptional regulator